MGIPAWATWPRGQQWDQWDTGNPWATGQPGQDWTDGINWTNWTDWISPHWEWDWNGGTTYTKLAMVRYPDTDNVYWTWIRTDDADSWATPGVDSRWKKMNRDGDTWPQWDAGGTIVVPVEWKPWKDWVWVDGKDWKNWISPHNEWIWNSSTEYTPLALVRAPTGLTDSMWNDIWWWFITQNGSTWDEPKDWWPRALVVRDWDWEVWFDVRKMSKCLVKATSQTITKTFDSGWVQEPVNVTFTNYVWWDSIEANITQIIVPRDWYYRIFWHAILQCDEWAANPYINMWRISIYKNNDTFLWTDKSWWPYINNQVSSGLRLWLHIDMMINLTQWDTLTMRVRCQSDNPNSSGQVWTYKVVWYNDTSWQTDAGSLWWIWTYMWLQLICEEKLPAWELGVA